MCSARAEFVLTLVVYFDALLQFIALYQSDRCTEQLSSFVFLYFLFLRGWIWRIQVRVLGRTDMMCGEVNDSRSV